MELVDHYLDLERARFGDRLTVDVEIAPDVLDALVPSLLVQTLVENAVRHGIEGRRGPGRITIEGRIESGYLLLEVRDTGPGFGNLAATNLGHGIGLENATARLTQLYGDDAGIHA